MVRPPLDGSAVLVTGASSGIGTEIARQLAHRARALVLVARRADRLAALRDELVGRHPQLVVAIHPCDLADQSATDAMLAAVEREIGLVDVLVNNAGVGDRCLYESADWDKTRRMIELNVTALAYLTRRLLPSMIARGRGGILNVSSLFGLSFLPGYAAYVGSKHFVSGFTEALRAEVRGAGVAVSHLCPGPVATEFEGAGSFLGRPLPSMALLSAERCARWALRGFGRGRALIVPGVAANVLAWLSALTPLCVVRAFSYLVARKMRSLAAKSL